jgi:predicted Ser/Thr protein kinase
MTTSSSMPKLRVSSNVNEVLDEAKKRGEERRAQRSQWLERAGDGKSEVTMRDYMNAGVAEPWIFDDAQQRIFRVLFADPGILRVNYGTYPRWARSLGLRQDEEIYLPVRFLDEFYGIDFLLQRFLFFVLNGARGGEAQRQMFIMYGDAGTGKSQLAEASKRYLTESIIFKIEGCPINDHPFWVLPKSERQAIAEKMGVRIPQDKDICRKCSEMLHDNYDSVNWEQVKVEAVTTSIRQMRGIDVVPPFDPNTMGSEVMIGRDEFYRKQVKDYMNWTYAALGNSNGGILEFREWFKAPPEARHIIYMHTQEQQFPNPGYQGYSSANAMIIAHTNLPEVKRLKVGGEHDAFFDRVYSDFALYPLSYRDNLKILEKMLARTYIPRELSEEERERVEESKLKVQKSFLVPSPLTLIYDRDALVHAGPGALAFAAKVKSISHIDPKEGGDERSGVEIVRLLSMLAGEGEDDVEEIRKHREEHLTEGLHGFSPRFIDKCVEDAYARSLLRWRSGEGALAGSDMLNHVRSKPCADIEDIREAILSKLDHELVLAIESEDKQAQASIQMHIDMLKGSFMQIILSERNHTIFTDFKESGLMDKAIGAGTMERTLKEGREKYFKEAKVLIGRQLTGDNDIGGIDVAYLSQIEAIIQNNMAQSFGDANLFRQDMVNLWEEQARRRAELASEDEGSNGYMLDQLARAVDGYVYATRSQEFLEQVYNYVKSLAGTGEASFSTNVMNYLPKYYCPSCLLRGLESAALSLYQ